MSTNQAPSGGGAWKTLEELAPKMSPADFAADKRRRDVGLFLGPIVFAIILWLPLPGELTFKANLALAVTAWTMIWWICEPIPMPATALFASALFMFLQVLPAPAVMNQLGNTNTWYLIATFIFMNALVKHGFALRVAYWLLSRPIGRKSPYHLLGLYLFAVGFVSIWLSNMACTMLFLAISAGMIAALQIAEDHTMSQAMRLGSAYGSQAGGLGTPMGAAGTNFLMIGLIVQHTGYNFTVTSWILAGFPFAILMIFVLIFYFRAVFRIELPNYQKACDYAKEQLDALGALKRGEKLAVSVAGFVIICWLLPDALQMILGAQHQYTTTVRGLLSNATVAIFGATLCFLLPVNFKEGKFLMTWTDANRYIDWGAILLAVCGFIMSAALGAQDVGILAAVANGLGSTLGSVSTFTGVFVLVAFSVALTQVIANTPAIAIMLPVGYAVSQAIGLNPVATMLAMGYASQASYALPVAAPQTAFVYGTGSVSIKQFILYGSGFSVISVFTITCVAYYLAAFLFPM